MQTAAKRGAPVLADVRFSAESHATLFPASRSSTLGSPGQQPKAGSKGASKSKSKARKSTGRRGGSSFCVPLPMYTRPGPQNSDEGSGRSSGRSRNGSAAAPPSSKSTAHASATTRSGPSSSNSRNSNHVISGQPQPFPALGAFVMSRNSLLGGTVMHAIALHGSSTLARWACSDPKLVALLETRDALGLTPLAVAAKALANLLRPLYAPPPPPPALDSSSSSSSRSASGSSDGRQRLQGSDSVLADACRLHGVLHVLRSACGAETAVRHQDTRSALSGLALCMAYGSPSLEKEATCLDPFGLLGRDETEPQGRARIDSTSSSLSSVAPSPAGTPANAAAARAALALTNAALGITSPPHHQQGRDIDASYDRKDPFDSLDHTGDREGWAQRPSSAASSHSSSSSSGHSLHGHLPAESVLQHLFLYSIIAGYEARIHPKTGLLVLSDYHHQGSKSSGGKVATSGVASGLEWWTGRDRFNSLAAYTACGWALHGAVGVRVEVPMTQAGVQLLLAPLQKSTTLRHLDLSRLGFGGKLPSGIGLIPSLTYIDLFENQLTGALPGLELGALPNLRGLNLASNALCGDIPSVLFQPNKLPSTLWMLSLHTNLLGGVLPSSLWQCQHLKELWLGHNALRGPLPDAIGGLVGLQTLVLAANDLGGPLPDGLSKLQALRGLYLQENRLTGALPRGLFELTSLTSLSVRGNKLTGSLSSALGNMVSLQRLHLGHNQFTGTLPKSLGNLAALRHLYLNNNQFTGEIPCEALASPPHISTVCLIGNEGLTHRGRASKVMARLIHNHAFTRTGASTSAPAKGNVEQAATADVLKSHPLRKRGRINVQVLTIDPLAAYTDDAENWRV